MKDLKLPKPNIIISAVFISILFALAIVLLVLPDDVYYAMGDSLPEVGRYVWFVLFGFFGFVASIKMLVIVSRQKKLIKEYNALRKECGENAFFVAGYCKAINKNNSNAIKTTVSILGAAASAVLFGVGVFKIFSTDTLRLFLFCDDGMYIIRTKSRENVFIKNGYVKNAKITENYKEQLEMTCPCENFILTFDTERVNITNEELSPRLTLLAQHVAPSIEKNLTAE